jgi:hypothetical protein
MDLGGAELSDEMARQVLQFDLATLILPEPDQRRLVRAHDPRIRSADELPAVYSSLGDFFQACEMFETRAHVFLQRSNQCLLDPETGRGCSAEHSTGLAQSTAM